MNVTMIKTHEKSFFLRFHQGSTLSSEIFNESPKYNKYTVVVLQVMSLEEGYLLVEIKRACD